MSRLKLPVKRVRSFATSLPAWVPALAISATAGACSAVFCVLAYREAKRPTAIPVRSEVEGDG